MSLRHELDPVTGQGFRGVLAAAEYASGYAGLPATQVDNVFYEKPVLSEGSEPILLVEENPSYQRSYKIATPTSEIYVGKHDDRGEDNVIVSHKTSGGDSPDSIGPIRYRATPATITDESVRKLANSFYADVIVTGDDGEERKIPITDPDDARRLDRAITNQVIKDVSGVATMRAREARHGLLEVLNRT